MYDALARRMAQFTSLSYEEMKHLETLCEGRPRRIPPKTQLVRESEPLGSIPYVVRGLLYSYKHLEDGRRQILSFSVEGDLCCLGIEQFDEADYSLQAVGEAIVLDISHSRFKAVALRSPKLAVAFSRAMAVDVAILRERLLALGQRTALERCAHLLCELYWRLRHVGGTRGRVMEFSVTQEELGSAIGISTIHANRMLRDLRALGLVAQHGRSIEILDLDSLERVALFNPHFLRLEAGTSVPAPSDLMTGFVPNMSDQRPQILAPT